jgi:hypothetical protein
VVRVSFGVGRGWTECKYKCGDGVDGGGDGVDGAVVS